VTPGVPLKSIGFVGSYGRGPGTVVGVGDVVRGVVSAGGANVGEVTVALGHVADGPTEGTSAVRVELDRERAVDEVVERLVEGVVDAGAFAARFLACGFAVPSEDESDARVVGGPAVTCFEPLEHAAKITVRAIAEPIPKDSRAFEGIMGAAYANPSGSASPAGRLR
jgi:hypothetical protein